MERNDYQLRALDITGPRLATEFMLEYKAARDGLQFMEKDTEKQMKRTDYVNNIKYGCLGHIKGLKINIPNKPRSSNDKELFNKQLQNLTDIADGKWRTEPIQDANIYLFSIKKQNQEIPIYWIVASYKNNSLTLHGWEKSLLGSYVYKIDNNIEQIAISSVLRYFQIKDLYGPFEDRPINLYQGMKIDQDKSHIEIDLNKLIY